MDTRRGRTIGNYRLIRLLGRGGFADVYLGENIELATHVAIKVLREMPSEKDVYSFRDEARTVARLKHFHIVQVLDFIVKNNTAWLVMQYAPGGTLQQKHSRGTIVPLDSVVSYVKQIADALQVAHNNKIIHRDIKPQNMLLDENNQVLLSDFGIATIAHSTRSQMILDEAGTPYYMAPEQSQGKPKPASDQYALGVVVYEWLSGSLPFEGTRLEVAMQHLTIPAPLFKKELYISPLVEAVVRKVLAKEPEQRFASIQEFADALEQAYLNQNQTDQHIPPTIQVPIAHDLPPSPLPATEKIMHVASASPSLGKLVVRYSGHAGNITDMAWSPNGKSIASASFDGTIHVWDVTTRKVIFNSAFERGSGYVSSLACSPNGAYIALANPTGIIQLFGIADGKEYIQYQPGQNSYGVREQVSMLKWAPDGRAIAFRSFYSHPFQNSIKVWSMQNMQNIISYNAHHAQILSFEWSPDSNQIASSSQSVHVWDAANGNRLFIFHDISDWVNAVTWSPDGQRIASGGDDKTVQIWDAFTGEDIRTYPGHSRWWGGKVTHVAWSPQWQYIASSSDKIIQVWDVTTGELIYTYQGHSGNVQTFVWSPDGHRIASISGDNKVHLWYPFTEDAPFLYTKHTGEIQDILWSPDGTRIASCSQDKTVQVWEAI